MQKVALLCCLLTALGCEAVRVPVVEDYTKTVPANCEQIDGTFWFTTGYDYDGSLGVSTVSCDAAAEDWMNNGVQRAKMGVS